MNVIYVAKMIQFFPHADLNIVSLITIIFNLAPLLLLQYFVWLIKV